MSSAAKTLSEATGRSIDYVDSDADAFYERYPPAASSVSDGMQPERSGTDSVIHPGRGAGLVVRQRAPVGSEV